MTRKRRSRVKHYLLPHRGNGYKPQLFAASSIAIVIAAVVILQGLYFFTTQVVFKQSDFLASVLPGALVALTNTDRAENNLGALIEDQRLAAAAQLKADDMAAKGYFAHVTPEGYQPWHWLEQVGYDYTYAGENLAVNFTDSEEVEEAWMNSPTHRANIVKPEYTHVGIATANGTYKGKEVTFVVQMFATKPGEVAPPEPEEAVIATADEEPAAPVAEEAEAPTVAAGIVAETQVLGEETTAAIEQAATSPTRTIVYILSGLALLILLVLIVAFFVHLKTQYVQALGGGVALLAVVVGFMLFNASNLEQVEVPEASQSASVINAFPGLR